MCVCVCVCVTCSERGSSMLDYSGHCMWLYQHINSCSVAAPRCIMRPSGSPRWAYARSYSYLTHLETLTSKHRSYIYIIYIRSTIFL